MNRKTKISLLIFVVVAIFGVWAFISSVNLTKNFNSQEIEQADSAVQQADIDDLVITETKDGQKYWEIYARKGNYDKKTNKAVLTDVTGNFYDNNVVKMSFEADKGVYNQSEKEIILNQNALVVAEDDKSISAQTITWKGTSEDIVATGHVVVNKSNEIKTLSNKTIFNKDFTRFKIIGKTQTRVYKKL